MTGGIPGSEFLQNLLLDAIKKIDDMSEKVDVKIDSLEEKLMTEHRDLRGTINLKVDSMEQKIEDHSIKLTRHEHNFTILGFLMTGGFATLAGIFNWFGQMFGHK